MLFSFMLAALTNKEAELIGVIYEKYYDQMFAVAYDILKNKHDASDAVNDTFLKLIRHIEKLRHSDERGIWNQIILGLKSSIYNTSCTNYRIRQRLRMNEESLCSRYDETEEDYSLDTSDPGVENGYIIREEKEIIRIAIQDLTPNMQDVINLVYYEKYSCEEAADFLGISSEAVRNRLFHARKNLKKVLRKDFSEYDTK